MRYTAGHPASLLRNCDREVGPVCGPQQAGGHAVRLVCRRLRAGADRARALAGDVAKDAPERAQALPAGVEGDLGDGPIGVAQQRRRPLDAPRQQVAVRRDAESLLERSGEVRRGHAADARQASHGPVLVRGGVHPVLRAQQAAQQPGVLASIHVGVHSLRRETRASRTGSPPGLSRSFPGPGETSTSKRPLAGSNATLPAVPPPASTSGARAA